MLRTAALPGAAIAALLGALAIFAQNRWEVDSPTVFLTIGWFGIVGFGVFLLVAGLSVVSESASDVGFALPSRTAELVSEKKALLKALKEIEFDRQLGKMSDADAKSISSMYRHQAIEIIKELDRREAGGELEPAELVERELRARLEVEKVKKKKRAGSKVKEKTKKEPKDAASDSTAAPSETPKPAKEEPRLETSKSVTAAEEEE